MTDRTVPLKPPARLDPRAARLFMRMAPRGLSTAGPSRPQASGFGLSHLRRL